MSRKKQAPPLAYPGNPQHDHVAEHPTTCPTCGGPWKAAKRVCRKCGQPIGRGTRWRLVPAGPGLFGIEHRDPCHAVAPNHCGKCGLFSPCRCEFEDLQRELAAALAAVPTADNSGQATHGR